MQAANRAAAGDLGIIAQMPSHRHRTRRWASKLEAVFVVG